MEEVDSVEVIMKFCTLLAFIVSGIVLSTEDATSYKAHKERMDFLAEEHYNENETAFDKSLNYEEIVEVTKKLLQSRKDEFTGSDKLYTGNDKIRLVYLNYYYGQIQGLYIRSNAKRALDKANVAEYSSDAIKIGKKEAINSLNEGIREYMKLIKDFCIKESSEEMCRDIVWPGLDGDIPLDDNNKLDSSATASDVLPVNYDGINNSSQKDMVNNVFPGKDDGSFRSLPADTVKNGAERKEETGSAAQGDANNNANKKEKEQQNDQKHVQKDAQQDGKKDKGKKKVKILKGKSFEDLIKLL
ncbi:hypothetical protein DSO57_1011886 [Entomophthora muscae]|uniref:Uncharacterized protein n=1 Tax=Entomophthora muscae TaxID=34485 RepID=A0ACC2RXD8_9FUNG|nr:hypothetical protein DSO57_1011886 [Entomophthora muscae]